MTIDDAELMASDALMRLSRSSSQHSALLARRQNSRQKTKRKTGADCVRPRERSLLPRPVLPPLVALNHRGIPEDQQHPFHCGVFAASSLTPERIATIHHERRGTLRYFTKNLSLMPTTLQEFEPPFFNGYFDGHIWKFYPVRHIPNLPPYNMTIGRQDEVHRDTNSDELWRLLQDIFIPVQQLTVPERLAIAHLAPAQRFILGFREAEREPLTLSRVEHRRDFDHVPWNKRVDITPELEQSLSLSPRESIRPAPRYLPVYKWFIVRSRNMDCHKAICVQAWAEHAAIVEAEPSDYIFIDPSIEFCRIHAGTRAQQAMPHGQDKNLSST